VTTTDRFICGWYALATGILIKRSVPRTALEYATEGAAVCPADPRVRLWQGIAADNGGIYPGPHTVEAAYREALKIDAGYMDARLRLGELLDRMKSDAEAARELAAVADSSADPPIRYLAHLFAGRLKQRAGDLPGAAAEYDAARTIGRGCQAAYVALSFVEDWLGDHARARDVAAQFANMPDDQRSVDPALGFNSGAGVDPDLMDTLRKAARP
jgi:hypothetical protein